MGTNLEQQINMSMTNLFSIIFNVEPNEWSNDDQ